VVQWLGCAAYAHALSIVLAYNKRSILKADPDYPKDGTTGAQEEFFRKAGWTALLKHTGRSTDVIHTDVDLECLSVFEQRLFEKSAQSGSAGNYQWGLDAGTIKMVGTHMLSSHPAGTTRVVMKEILIMMKMGLTYDTF
jgi:hypothetical protein